MTPLPKHLEEMRDELAEIHAGKRYKKLLGSYVSQSWQASVVDHNVGFQNCYSILLKDMESMAKVLEFYAAKEKYFMRKRTINLQETTAVFKVDDPSKLPTDYVSEVFECSVAIKVDQGKKAAEALKIWREKYGESNDQAK